MRTLYSSVAIALTSELKASISSCSMPFPLSMSVLNLRKSLNFVFILAIISELCSTSERTLVALALLKNSNFKVVSLSAVLLLVLLLNSPLASVVSILLTIALPNVRYTSKAKLRFFSR